MVQLATPRRLLTVDPGEDVRGIGGWCARNVAEAGEARMDVLAHEVHQLGSMACSRWLGVLVAVIGLAGCGQGDYRFSDDVDFVLDFSRGKKDHLTTPYVAGAEVSFSVWDEDDRRGTDFTGWRLASSDEQVLRVTDVVATDERVEARGFAMGEGIADLVLLDEGGEVVSSVEVPVGFPTRVELLAAAPMFLGRDDVPARAQNPQVLVDARVPRRDSSGAAGTFEATFLVRYFDGNTRLHGHRALELDHQDGIDAWVEHSYFAENRDWLKVRPLEEGVHALDLQVGGRTFATAEITGVGAEAVERVELFGEDESRASEGDQLLVIAQAFDEGDEPIYGVAYHWSLAGREETEVGDMYRYIFDPSARSTLVADFEGVGAQATIRGVEGFVGSSNEISCSIDPNGRTPTWTVVLLGLGLLARRRKAWPAPVGGDERLPHGEATCAEESDGVDPSLSSVLVQLDDDQGA
jgi:MYXO-CTERM domain-containing protein